MAESSEYTQSAMWRQAARRWVAHVDMDAFFASVEQHDNAQMRGRPLIVGNSPLPMERLRELAAEAARLPHTPDMIKGVRGVVASASYEARAFGVRSAMPLARALALCTGAIVVAGRFDRYKEVAEQLRDIWAEFSPVVEPVSLDEAYLDITGADFSEGPVRGIAERLKARIKEETGLTASVGIGSSKLVAKIASDLDKPDGLTLVEYGDEARTLAPLPVRALPGVGPRTAEALASLGISVLGELANCEESRLAAFFGREQASRLLRRAAGVDDTPVEAPGEAKSISREITLSDDSCDLDDLKSKLKVLSDHVAWTLRQEGFCARCVYIKLRLLPRKRVYSPEGSSFGRLLTRQCTLPVPLDSGHLLYDAAASLLDKTARTTGLGSGQEVVRLLGVGTSSLVHVPALQAHPTEAPVTVQIAAEEAPLVCIEHNRRLDASLDKIRERYGFGAITLGRGVERHGVTTDDG